MEINKYASKSCMKCKVLDRILKSVNLPCSVNTLYVEDNEELFKEKGIEQLPTLEISNEGKESIYLTGTIAPKQIAEAIDKLR